MEGLFPVDNCHGGHSTHQGNEEYGTEGYGDPDVHSLQTRYACHQEGGEYGFGAVGGQHAASAACLS